MSLVVGQTFSRPIPLRLIMRKLLACKHSRPNKAIMLMTVVRLLDPSCSGSGIVNRLDYLLENGTFLVGTPGC